MVGYSRLMGNDHDTTVQTLAEYREVFSSNIQQFQGRVVNAPGDSIWEMSAKGFLRYDGLRHRKKPTASLQRSG